MPEKIKIKLPFDGHVHLRIGEMMHLVTPYTANQFGAAIVMPNLQPPIVNVDMALDYKKSIEHSEPNCNYIMAIYLTESTTIEDVQKAKENGMVFKLYPANATTGSADGIKDIKNVYPLFKEMERLDVALLIHGEVTRSDVDIFKRERVFIKEVLVKIIDNFPDLKITLEHITTKYAVNFVKKHKNLFATITVHHMYINRNAIFTVGEKTALNPNNFCLPIAKKNSDRSALIDAAISGDPSFFAGTDSAPHPKSCKASLCGCAGIFTAYSAVELYTTIFEQADALDKLENFLSIFGRKRYGIEIPNVCITIKRKKLKIPYEIGTEGLTPFMAGETLEWKVEEEF